MQKTKVEIIKQTAEFYNNKNRSLNPSYDETKKYDPYYQIPACLYNGPDGKHCAFAMCCDDPSVLSKYEGIGVRNLSHNLYLKNEYKGHDQDFWSDIQKLHDTDDYWTDDGISEIGKLRVEYLIEKYENENNPDWCPF